MRIPSSPKVTDKGMIALSRQTLEGSTLSRLLHVPSDPNWEVNKSMWNFPEIIIIIIMKVGSKRTYS